MMKLNDKKVLVIGLGASGQSAAAFLLRQKACVIGVDSNPEQLASAPIESLRCQGMKTAHEHELTDLADLDLVVISPGVPPTTPLCQNAKALGIEVIGEVELACRFLQGPFLGITGTNGKTTVTLLVEHVLKQSGVRARALGNMGVALTSECLDVQHSEVLVVELSSFQLETMQSQVMDAAVILNITPDHLDRYSTVESYARAKMLAANCLKPQGTLYLEQKCYETYGFLIPHITPKTYGYDSRCDIYSDLISLYAKGKMECTIPLHTQGKRTHDLENIMAAYALCQHVGIPAAQFMEAIASFKKPPHRIEFVTTINGIAYYDDSKGTNVDAVIRAVEMVQGKIILIAGGVDKGSSYTPWISAFANKVKRICAIGQAAAKINQELGSAIPVQLCQTLEDAVVCAAKYAQPGENVLLSPGCSSYDMFRDYAHRGQEFQRLIRKKIDHGERLQ